jgi:uncharacterized membrane protein YoaK (UPF0700 family)
VLNPPDFQQQTGRRGKQRAARHCLNLHQYFAKDNDMSRLNWYKCFAWLRGCTGWTAFIVFVALSSSKTPTTHGDAVLFLSLVVAFMLFGAAAELTKTDESPAS